MPDETARNFESILIRLAEGQVEFLVIGGVCAALQGAPVQTFDLDLLYARKAENLLRLERALRKMHATYREKKSVTPDASLLDGPGHHLLMTDFGPLDLLGATVNDLSYDDLIDRSDIVDLSDGVEIRILDLPMLIRIKEILDRDRDRATLPILRKTLEERSKD